MKRQRPAGLVGAGGVTRSYLARMPALLGRLGPVKGASLRVSRRIANGLRAGTGVSDYSAFKSCQMIWIAVPEASLDAVSAALASAVPLAGKIIVLCDVMRDSFWPSPLRTAGALLVTMNCLPESDERTFVAEGKETAICELRKILALDGRKLIHLKPASKALYLSGIHLGAHLLLPWIGGAVESLRASGFTRAEAARVVQALGSHALRAYDKAGRKALNAVEAERLYRAIQHEIQTLRLTDPRLASLNSDGFQNLLRFFLTREAQESIAVHAG